MACRRAWLVAHRQEMALACEFGVARLCNRRMLGIVLETLLVHLVGHLFEKSDSRAEHTASFWECMVRTCRAE